MMEESGSSFSRWAYAHYFEFLESKDSKNILVKCKLCVKAKPLSTSKNSTSSNLTKHLQRCHPNTKLVKLASDETSSTSTDEPPSKQAKLSWSRPENLHPRQVRRLVAEYIVEDMLPLSTVESPAFRNITSKIPVAASKETVLQCRKTFTKDLDEAYAVMARELKKTLDGQYYLSTTADLWSSHNRSYLGVTVHWIDDDTLKRRKAAIACRRFKGRHTYDKIAAELEDIFSEYGLTPEKNVACVTDNGSNFVKAFHEYQHVESEEEVEEMDEGEEDSDGGEVHFTDLQSVLSAVDEEDGQVGLCVLPPHHRCAAHTLNLIANNDVDKWLATNPESRAIYRSATAKCSSLWTKASRSTVAAECVEEVADKKLIVPTVTRWNSFFDAYARVTEMSLTDINELCTRFQMKRMNDREYQFLKEYCAILKPFTVALDILQGEDTCFYGTLQPTLEVLMAKTLSMKSGLSPMTTGLPEIIVGAIKTRFASILDSKAALLAAVSLPKFKLRWVKEETRRDHITLLLTTECRTIIKEEPVALMPEPAASAPSEDDFFSFEEQVNVSATLMSVETEVTSYLNSAPVMESLHLFPRIKQIALRYNAPTPSSAPVERLFSLGSLVLTPKRNRLSDERFQRILLMRFNKFFSQGKD